MLNFVPLNPTALWVALLAFAGTCSLILLSRRFQWRYSGLILTGSLTLLSFFFLPLSLWLGLLAASFLLALGGILDEKFSLPPGQQLLWQLAAALTAVSFGWTIPYVTHPFESGVLSLAWLSAGTWLLPGSLIALLWLIIIMNTLNWLDGSDGLAGSLSVVVFLTLAVISLLPSTQDSLTLQLALLGLGATTGFLLFNWPPAQTYLGTTGVWYLGLYLGLVAIIGGGKIATTLLVFALPLLDALFVIIQRLLAGEPPWRGRDRRHLHDRLKGQGLSPAGIASLSLTVSALLALSALALPTLYKLLLALLLTLLGSSFLLWQHYAKTSS
jgi:UDP-GlcNAc:undecaprenyl-phosphate GlcNAc-1-phosphate transferase